LPQRLFEVLVLALAAVAAMNLIGVPFWWPRRGGYSRNDVLARAAIEHLPAQQ